MGGGGKAEKKGLMERVGGQGGTVVTKMGTSVERPHLVITLGG